MSNAQDERTSARETRLRDLVGSGDRIGLFVLPVAILGVALNVEFPLLFDVAGPPAAVAVLAAMVLGIGVVIWLWSVVLILTRVPRGELITTGPFALVKHPLYVGVSLLVLPALGVLLNTWLGIALGLVMYLATRLYAPEEERELAERFGAAWDRYATGVRFPGL